MSNFTEVQSGSFWNATGTVPAGSRTVQGCNDICRTFSNSVGFNSDVTGSAQGECYCFVASDLGFSNTGSQFTSYIFSNTSSGTNSGANNSKLLVGLLIGFLGVIAVLLYRDFNR
jgi:hypothetical protein